MTAASSSASRPSPASGRQGARRSRPRGAGAFTLFEVAISLTIIAFGIVSVALVFPTGIKAVQLSRFQLYASAKAIDMIDAYNGVPTAEPSLDTESPTPWDVSTGRTNTAFDLERRLSSFHFGIIPLPMALANRIDSDNDEIQGVLSEGGYLYYSQPMATTGFMEGAASAPSTEAQKLVFTVEGYAQSNAITVFPWKAWPYYYPFPSPPAHGTHGLEKGFSEPLDTQNQQGWRDTWGGKTGILWEDTFDPDMRYVFFCTVGGTNYGYKWHQQTGTLASATQYCQAALWYAAKKGLPPSFYDIGSSHTYSDFTKDTSPALYWQQVQALRFLAHATACLTNYVTSAGLASPGVIVNPIALDGSSAAPVQPMTVTTDKIIALHDSCMNLAMRFAASFPYDWSVPRPLARAIMMDDPLIEYDLFTQPLSGTIWQSSTSTAGAQGAQQWRPIPAQPIQNIGTSQSFSNETIPASDPSWAWWARGAAPAPGRVNGVPAFAPGQPSGFWGNPDHFTLTHPFSPDERCRQLVFWAVDWQSYEDFETLPSAPVDAARYCRGAPRAPGGGWASFTNLLSNPPFIDWQQYAHRNPEKVMAFTSPAVGALPTGSSVAGMTIGADGAPGTTNPSQDQVGQNQNALSIFSGQYGADRNFNQVLDRGPIPRSVRLHAVLVARFNFYDMRVPSAIR
jgi:hypothetical protein